MDDFQKPPWQESFSLTDVVLSGLQLETPPTGFQSLFLHFDGSWQMIVTYLCKLSITFTYCINIAKLLSANLNIAGKTFNGSYHSKDALILVYKWSDLWI
jgi:hypothetical protein